MTWLVLVLHTTLFLTEAANALLRDNNGKKKQEYLVYCLWLRYSLIVLIGIAAWSSTHAIIALLCAATVYNWIGTWLAANFVKHIVNRSR